MTGQIVLDGPHTLLLADTNTIILELTAAASDPEVFRFEDRARLEFADRFSFAFHE